MASPSRPGASGSAPAEAGGGFRTGGALFLLALLVRLLYVSQASGADPTFGDPEALVDTLYYHQRASAFALGETPTPALDYLSPAYALGLGLVYRLVGIEPLAAIVLQAALGALCCLMLYAIGRRVFSEGAGIAAALLFALFGPQVYYGGYLLSDTLVLALNVAFLLALVPPRGRLALGRAGVAGLLLGLAVGARPNAILLWPLGLAASWLRSREAPGSRHLLAAAVLSLGLAVGLSPFAYRNLQAIGELALLGPTGGINLWKGNGPQANGTHVFLAPGESWAGVAQQVFGQVSDDEVMAESREYTRRTLAHVRAEPARAARLLLRKAVLFFHDVELGIRDHFYLARDLSPVLWLAPLGFGVLAPLGLAGMWLARGRREAALLHGAFAAQLASLVIVFVLGRYRLVAAAILALFAGHALTTWAAAWRQGHGGRATPTLLLALAVAMLVHVPLAEFPRERGLALRQHDLATAYAARGRHRDAIAAFEAVATEALREPSPELAIASARLGQAEAHLALGEHAEARALIRPFLAPSPALPAPLARRAQELWERAGDASTPD